MKENAENYWPISFTCVCSKVMEHTVHSQVSQFLEDHHILSPSQHGFRPGRSCETQLISALHDWSSWLDRGIPTDVASTMNGE